MKHLSFIIILFSLSMNAQDLTWDESIDGNFDVESITLNEPGGEGNIVNVSGVAGEWKVYMTFRFTNALRTSGQGEYTANAWAEKGTDLMTTTVRGIWKKEENHYSMKHFENTSKGGQLLTTGVLDLQKKTYKCVVRFLK